MTREKYLGVCLASLLGIFSTQGQPVNDLFAHRTTIVWAGTNVTISSTLANTMFEAGEPFLSGISSGQTAWWTWVAPSNGIVTFTIAGTGFSPLLTVYSGNELASLSLVASNNYLACYESASCGCHWRMRNQTTLHVARGQAYQVAVDSAIITDASFQYIAYQPPEPVLTEVGVIVIPHYPGPNYVVPMVLTGVQTTNAVSGSDLQLGMQFIPAPRNDDFEERLALAGSRKQIVASNAGATRQSGEMDHAGNPGGSSVWYSWTAPASGRVTLSTNNIPPYVPPAWSSYGFGVSSFAFLNWAPTCGKEIDQSPPPIFYPVFAAYTGTNLTSLVSANALPLALDAYPHAIEFDVIKGQTYQLAFDGNHGTTGTLPLYLALTKPAANDHFKNHIQVRSINIAATGFNAGATHEAGEPAVTGSNGKSVWWSWTAPVSGTVAIDLDGSDHVFPVGVFTGTTVSNLKLIATGTGALSFEAVQGQSYKLSVNDADALTGAIKLRLQAPVVELPLTQTRVHSGNVAVLSYAASPRQIVLFQSSADASTWTNVRTTLARQTTVNFLTHPAPTASGPYYRAIVVDYQ